MMKKKAYQKPNTKVLAANTELLESVSVIGGGTVDGKDVLGKEHNFHDDEDDDVWGMSYSVWDD
jgi:hypothetical protein